MPKSQFARLALWLCLSLAAAAPLGAQAPANKSADQAARRVQAGNLVGHGGPVKAIARHIHGGRFLTGSFDYSAILWEVTAAGPRVAMRFSDHNGAVNAVGFITWGDSIVTAGDDGRVSVWRETGELRERYEGHEGKIVALDIEAGEQRLLTSGWDRTARVWDRKNPQGHLVLKEHRGPVNGAVFSGATIYTASADGYIRAFDSRTGEPLRRVHSAGQSVTALVRLRTGDAAVATTPGPRRDLLLFGTVSGVSGVVDGLTGEVVFMLPEMPRPILAVAESTMPRRPDSHAIPQTTPGLIAVGSGDGQVRVFHAETGQLVQGYKTPFGPVWALAFDTRGIVDDAKALYHAGLDDFVTFWPFAPRAAFDHVDTSQYPRRFQVAGSANTPIGRGEIQFARKCSICHTLTPDSANRAGPTLHNIFGRRIATLPGYPYSPELKTLDIVWNAETISKLFELGPDKFTPGSKMPLQVMSSQAERDDLIAFLQLATQDGAANNGAPVDAKPAPPQKTP